MNSNQDDCLMKISAKWDSLIKIRSLLIKIRRLRLIKIRRRLIKIRGNQVDRLIEIRRIA